MQRVASVEKADVFLLKSNPPKIGVTANGTVPSTGWTDPELGPWYYLLPPADGIQDFDFYATEPTGIVIPVKMPIAAYLIIDRQPDNYWGPGKPLVGVRIHSQSNSVEARFGAAGQLELHSLKAGDEDPFPLRMAPFSTAIPASAPFPWPWPWHWVETGSPDLLGWPFYERRRIKSGGDTNHERCDAPLLLKAP